MRYRVGVIGAGRIAAGFDQPGDPHVLTHAHAVLLEPRFELVGFWDFDPEIAGAAARKWGVPLATSLESLLKQACDMIIVAVPDDAHEPYLRQLIDAAPRLVICEKPLTLDLDSASAIVQAYENEKIPLLVNFQRRFDSSVVELKARLNNGQLGLLLGGVVWYSKGVKHNGSHAIDLLRFLFGEPEIMQVSRSTNDYRADDPTVSGQLRFGDVVIALLGGNERLFSLFEIDLLFEHGRYRFSHSGLTMDVFEPRPDPVFAGYVELFSTYSGPTGLPTSLQRLMNSAADYLDGGPLPPNTAADALRTQELCSRLACLAADI